MKGAVLLEFMYMDLFAFLLHGFGEFEESIARTILKGTEHGRYRIEFPQRMIKKSSAPPAICGTEGEVIVFVTTAFKCLEKSWIRWAIQYRHHKQSAPIV
jgi:hypothetical protein